MKKFLLVIVWLLFSGSLYSQPNIVKFEYYFVEISTANQIPATPVSITPTPDATVNINIGLSGINFPAENYHLYLYAVDANGVRSLQFIDTQSLVIDPTVSKKVAVRVILQGPYDASGDTMRTTMHSQIPLTSPYSEDPRTVTSIPEDIVDWVLVELRETTAIGSVVADTSAFLHKNGSIVADDGITNEITLKTQSMKSDFFIVVKHRNHLALMNSVAITLSDVFSVLYDFTTAQTQAFTTGPNPMYELEAGVFGMFCGDGNMDGSVDAADLNGVWRPDNGSAGYLLSDFNLDGGVDAMDRNICWRPNNGTATQVP